MLLLCVVELVLFWVFQVLGISHFGFLFVVHVVVILVLIQLLCFVVFIFSSVILRHTIPVAGYSSLSDICKESIIFLIATSKFNAREREASDRLYKYWIFYVYVNE